MIWLVGQGGLLGQELAAVFGQQGVPFVGTGRELDIRDPLGLEKFATLHQPDWIVNCAAYTAVDQAEVEPEAAFALNARGPANLAAAARACGAAMLQLSTDYVFSGEGFADAGGLLQAYREADPAQPRTIYGKSKLEGERLVRQTLPRHIILRTAWLYGRYGNNFVYKMLYLMRQNRSISIVADQHGSPSWSRSIAQASLEILTLTEPRWGTYHLSGAGATSWFEFALEIQRLGRKYGILDQDAPVRAVGSKQFPARAQRPAWSVLDSTAIGSAFGIVAAPWQESLEAFFQEIAPVWRSIPFMDSSRMEVDL